MDPKLTIAHYIRTLADKYEDRPAICFKSAFRTFSYSYRDMHQRSLRVANYLTEKGINKGDRIIIWSYNGQEYASVLLGCALAGVVPVPVDFSFKADFVELIADRVEAKHLFHSRRRPYPSERLSHIHVEDLDGDLSDTPIKRTDFGVGEDDILEIMYTSGTTSEPKGVIITNKNLISNVMQVNKVMPVESCHSFLSVLPLSHVFEQVAGFFWPLHHGCRITYLHSRKSTAITDALQREGITMMAVVPIFLRALQQSILRKARAQGKEKQLLRMLPIAKRLPMSARRMLFSSIHKKLGGKLETFISGGAALNPELESFWTSLGIEVFQGYGLTEASPVVSVNIKSSRKTGSVGKSLPGQDIKLGPDNEIWIRGDNVTPGYYHNPEEDRARFENGWYKTGDIGEIDDEGFLFIRGRLKNMIQPPSGLNVYPEDIQIVLNNTPGVRDSCVIGLAEGGDIRVHAVLLLDKGRERSEEAIHQIIASANRQLQPHQQIQECSIWPYDDFPRTNTFKIKRGPVQDEIQNKESARGMVQQFSGDRVLDLIANLAKVDVQTIRPEWRLVNDLGMDSITRVELAVLLEEEFGVEIDESALTAETTVTGLRGIIASQREETLPYSFPRWATTLPTCMLRRILQVGVFRIPSLFSRTTVKNRHNLDSVQPPVLFVSNQVSHYDPVYIARALPRRFRRLAVSAAADAWFEINPDLSWTEKSVKHFRKLCGIMIMNAYPFSRDVHVKKSFEYMGELLDNGWNILLFPEGKLTTTGEMDSFRSGVGLLAQAMEVPVVPIKLEGLFSITNYKSWLPQHFGRVSIIFGQQVRAGKKFSAEELASQFENSIRSL